MSNSRFNQKGFQLVEVLVATVVLSIGLLGFAILQAKTLATNNGAMGRSMAIMSSYSILEAMRSDRANAVAGNYNITVYGSTCNDMKSNTLTEDQLKNWCNELSMNLGAVDSTIGIVNCKKIGECSVTIYYDDSKSGVIKNTKDTTILGSSRQSIVTTALL